MSFYKLLELRLNITLTVKHFMKIILHQNVIDRISWEILRKKTAKKYGELLGLTIIIFYDQVICII